jgi:hypothetical protein
MGSYGPGSCVITRIFDDAFQILTIIANKRPRYK